LSGRRERGLTCEKMQEGTETWGKVGAKIRYGLKVGPEEGKGGLRLKFILPLVKPRKSRKQQVVRERAESKKKVKSLGGKRGNGLGREDARGRGRPMVR